MMKSILDKQRPRYLNLAKIRLPVTGVVSITHRITGIVMILCVPFCAYLLELSLRNESGFQSTLQLLDNIGVRLFLAIGLWSVAHHLFAGIRYLLFDIDLGVEKASAKRAAWIVVVADAIALAVILGWWL